LVVMYWMDVLHILKYKDLYVPSNILVATIGSFGSWEY
jgi:hypothetical protein